MFEQRHESFSQNPCGVECNSSDGDFITQLCSVGARVKVKWTHDEVGVGGTLLKFRTMRMRMK